MNACSCAVVIPECLRFRPCQPAILMRHSLYVRVRCSPSNMFGYISVYLYHCLPLFTWIVIVDGVHNHLYTYMLTYIFKRRCRSICLAHLCKTNCSPGRYFTKALPWYYMLSNFYRFSSYAVIDGVFVHDITYYIYLNTYFVDNIITERTFHQLYTITAYCVPPTAQLSQMWCTTLYNNIKHFVLCLVLNWLFIDFIFIQYMYNIVDGCYNWHAYIY